MKKWIGIVLCILFVTMTFSSTILAKDKVPENYGSKGALKDSKITLEEALTYALQDEYLSLTRYDVVQESFGYDLRPFPQLKYENRDHIQSLYQLCKNSGVPILKNNNDVVFYLELPKNAKMSLKEEINYENQNISMYDKFINQTNFSNDVKNVFRHLQKASRDHLNKLRTEFNHY